MTVLGLQWYCAFACLLCQSPCSPSLQVHSYISKHQYGFPISLGFPFFHIFPNAPFFKRYVFFFLGGEGGGYFCHIAPKIAFSGFSNSLFSPTQPIIFLNCVVVFFFGGGGGLYETFPSVPLSTLSIPTYFA